MRTVYNTNESKKVLDLIAYAKKIGYVPQSAMVGCKPGDPGCESNFSCIETGYAGKTVKNNT